MAFYFTAKDVHWIYNPETGAIPFVFNKDKTKVKQLTDNKIIELLHGCMLFEKGSPLDDQLNKVKTKKIVLYSNAIATSSSVISEYVLGQYDKIDLGGLLTLMKRVFTDIEFIYDVKYEFLKTGIEELI